jgi:hypothetical protein
VDSAGTATRDEYPARGTPGGQAARSYRAPYVKQLRLDGMELYTGTGIRYLVASSQCYGEYFWDPKRYPMEYADYQELFEQTDEVARFTPSSDHQARS